MRRDDMIKIGDIVRLQGYTGSEIGYNGLWCVVKNIIKKDNDTLYFCVSMNGSYRGLEKREHLRLTDPPNK